jgi:teichuronic acid exporter
MDTTIKKPIAKTDKKTIATGIFWTFVQLVINQAFSFGLKLLLAKFLFPGQFGLVGMATVFTGFVQVLNDLGVGSALVQRKAEDLRKDHFHTAFWTGVIWSVVLFLFMSVVVSNGAAYFYHEPLLKTIIPVLSIGILVSPVNMVHKAQLTKAMEFKRLAFIDNTANILAGSIALLMAFMGAGIWALIFNSVATIFFAMPMFFWATGWKPEFIFDKQAFKEVFGFGVYTTGSNLLNYLYNNIDYLLIGKLLGASSLGTYTLAFVLTDTFRGRLMTVINNVMYPVYGKKQDDILSLKNYYLKVILFNCLFVFPVMVYFVVNGNQFVIRIFGSKWQETVVPLQILSLSVMLHILVSGNTALLRGLGKPGLEMKQQILKALIFLPTLAIGIFYYGLIGAALAILLNKLVVVAFAQYTFKYLISVKISLFEFLNVIKGPVIAASITAVITYVFQLLGLNFLIAGFVTLICYSAIIWLIMKKEILALANGLKKKN